MFSCFTSLVSSCLNPAPDISDSDDDDDADESSSYSSSTFGDVLRWCTDLQRHSCGELSLAVVQAHEVIEDQNQVEIGSNAIFVGIYDGHGGPETSCFVREHLFRHLVRIVKDNRTINQEILRNVVSVTEDDFMALLVNRTFTVDPSIAAVGSSCLAAVIWKGTLHIANLGDSRAIIGSLGRCNKIIAEQLTVQHNASREDIREELRALHPQNPQIVVMNHGMWRVKGTIQVSRSIGDAYLKQPQFHSHSLFQSFHLSEPLTQPVLTAEPSLSSRVLEPHDKFIIFASDELWEHLTNQQAVETVHRNPRKEIARKLVKAALKEAANKRNMEYKELLKIEKGNRRIYYDDITVIFVFIEHELLARKLLCQRLR